MSTQDFWSTCLDKLTPNDKNGNASGSVLTIKCIPILFQQVINILLSFAGLVALILIITSGIKYILSSGDAKKAGEAQKTLTFAIIGLVIIFLSFFIVNLIANLTGISCIKQFGFDNCSSPQN